jgi:DNA invertase Pin-like site-specific DNA recombinase
MAILGYRRVSLEENAGNTSFETQGGQITAYAQFKWPGQPVKFVEDDVSGSITLCTRPYGSQLDKMLQAGDHVVFSRSDRAFRDQLDCLQTVKTWHQRGIGVHILDLGVDTTSDVGQLMLGVLSSVNEFERKRIRERLTEGLRTKYKGRHWPAQRPPYPYVYSSQRRCAVLDKEMRSHVALFMDLRAEGRSWNEIYVHLLARKIYRHDTRGTWVPSRIRILCEKEERLRKYEGIMKAENPNWRLPETLKAGDPAFLPAVVATVQLGRPVKTADLPASFVAKFRQGGEHVTKLLTEEEISLVNVG